MYYVAYGSNINKDQMNFRLPGAKPFGNGVIYNWQLAFHGKDGNAYATLENVIGKRVPVVIWEISKKQEAIMDKYEGYPKAYYKRKIPVHVNGKKVQALIYIMNETRRVARPSRKYVNTVRQGYETFGLDIEYLNAALIRNSQEYYLDDLLEVREFKKATKPATTSVVYTTTKGILNNKKSSISPDMFRWKKPDNNLTPQEYRKYMRQSFASRYDGADDDYAYDYTYGYRYSGSKKPSLDDYDTTW